MATSDPQDETDNAGTDSFHDVADSNDLDPPNGSLLMKMTQPEEKPLPVGVITE